MLRSFPHDPGRYARVSLLGCVVVGAIALLLSSCAFNKDSDAPNAGGAPGIDTPPLPDPAAEFVPYPSQAGFDTWLRIEVIQEAGPDSNPACDQPRRFALRREGDYAVTPCLSTGGAPARAGIVSGDVLPRLIELGDQVTRSDPSVSQTCEPLSDGGRLRVDLVYSSGARARVYETRADQPLACFRGAPTSARALAIGLRSLLSGLP